HRDCDGVWVPCYTGHSDELVYAPQHWYRFCRSKCTGATCSSFSAASDGSGPVSFQRSHGSRVAASCAWFARLNRSRRSPSISVVSRIVEWSMGWQRLPARTRRLHFFPTGTGLVSVLFGRPTVVFCRVHCSCHWSGGKGKG